MFTRTIPALLGCLAIALAWYPGIAWLEKKFKDPYYNLGNYGVMRAARRLAEITPQPPDVLDPERPPEYGVLAAWDVGNNVSAGRAAPGTLMTTRIRLISNQGKKFEYFDTAPAGRCAQRNNRCLSASRGALQRRWPRVGSARVD